MRIVFAGTPEPAVVALEKLIASHHEVVAVITRPDARKGRGRSLHPSPVKELAQRHGIEVLTPGSLRPETEDGQAIRQRLAELAPEAIPVVAYGNLITPDLLDVATHGWVNLHFSLLPQWRGAAPVQAAIAAGQTTTGATTFRIDEGLDTGPVLLTLQEQILPTDTADDLLTRLAHAGGDLLVETMDALEAGTANGVAQQGQATYAHKITTEDARISWSATPAEIDRHIRAHTPGPGAWTTWPGARVKVGPVTLLGGDDREGSTPDLPPLRAGEVHLTKKAVFIGTGGAPILLGTIQPPGKKMMNAADWGRGIAQSGKDNAGNEGKVCFE